MIYLDNAATSFPKPKGVLRTLCECAKKHQGNPGRSSHSLSLKSAEIIYDTREKVSELLSLDSPEGVVFTYNATYAINLALKSYITHGHVITSDIEHNAVMRPIFSLAERFGVEYSCFSTEGDVGASIEGLLREDTVCIISTICSNVTGKAIDLKILSQIAKKHGLYLIIDASQAIGHSEINLKKTPCDVLCAPAHKGLFGIQGCGFAAFSDSARKNTLVEGGSGSDSRSKTMPILLPEGYEAGTLATPVIASLGAGIDFINSVGVSEIEKRLERLSSLFTERISAVGGMVLYPSENGIISFNFKDIPSSHIARELDRRGIAVRSGFHCAPSAHKRLGTLENGTVRISLSYFNTKRQADRFYKALSDIGASLG